MNNRHISRRRFLKTGTLVSAGFALATSTGTLRSWAAPPSEPIDALVIGSGFGGAVAALRLAQAGVKTLVLERGRRWPITEAQNTFATLRNPDGRSSWLSPFAVVGDPVSPDAQPIPINVYTGVLELMGENGIAVYAGAGVGGGSLVYNGGKHQPTRANFDRVFRGAISSCVAKIFRNSISSGISICITATEACFSNFLQHNCKVFVESELVTYL